MKTGKLFIGEPDNWDRVASTVRMNQGLGVETGFVSFEEARQIEPLLTPPQGAPVVYEPHSGYAS